MSGALVYVGLGSNLGEPAEQVRRGICAVSALSGCRRLACSGLYRNPPMGPKDQPDYVNAVMAIDCSLSPASLLARLQEIEAHHGRVRSDLRWGPRTLDLDILLYGQERIETEDLVVPHRGIAERAFVLIPLAEIAPDLMIPGKGPLKDLLERVPADALTRID
ncbi:MAG: 2-amino-4-hydroxy-6-hydroxymethyldihydropteridine diphosphokinase [Gammaproteobacteria bacterium]